MKKFSTKIFSSTLALALGVFVSMSSAAQIQGFASGYAPGKVDVKKKVKGQKSDLDFDSDLVWGLGAEFLVNPVGPLIVGGGLGFISEQKDGDASLVMPAVPVFGSVGVIGPQKWPVRPYLGARVGYPVPASQDKSWWRKPQNFVVTGNVGVQLPYHMGLEFDCTYLTMYKYFGDQDMGFRTNSLKFGGSITVHFDLFGGNSNEPEKPAEKPAVADSVAAPVAEAPVSEETPVSDTPTEAALVEEPAAEPVDQPVAEEAAADESVAEPLQDDFETAAAATEPVEGTPAEETPAEESAEPAEEPAEEAAAAEPAEEPAEEPAVEEPAPEPEKKAAKKPSKKSKAKKKPAKKSKAKKKPAKKSKSKKK